MSATRGTGLRSATGARHARPLGLGAYRPSVVVPNADIVEAIDSSDEWIQQRSGIRSRRFAAPHETVLSMSVAAAREAIEDAGIAPEQIDAVIVATVSHMLQTPAAAPAIAHELGLARPVAFDISAACAGFCHGVGLADDMIRGGSARHVLVIGVERLSDITDPEDRGTAFIFADGAADAFAQVVRLKELLHEAGRPVDGFGLQCHMLRAKTPQAVVETIQRWRDQGGTHASVVTMGQGFRTTRQHLDYLEEVADALHQAGLPLTSASASR